VVDREQGSLGALLITPLTDARISLARIVGRIAGIATGPVVTLACSAILVTIAIGDPTNVVFGAVWLDAQCCLLMTFCWGIAGGALVSTAVMRFRWLRGMSLLTAIVGPALTLWLVNTQLPDSSTISGSNLFPVALMASAVTLSVIVCLLAVAAAYYQFSRLRHGDIDYGDQPAK
jgi:hypothetical protein